MENINTLCVFDFDGTLFRSPENTQENRNLYESSMGIPWVITKNMSIKLTDQLGVPINPRTGWWGRAETLMPPLVPEPAPDHMWVHQVVDHLQESKNNNNNKTIIATGRHKGIQQQVLRILSDGRVVDIKPATKRYGSRFFLPVDDKVDIYFSGMDGPMNGATCKPHSTCEWKIWIVDQYLNMYKNIEKVIFWEDRIEHAIRFKELEDAWRVNVTVNHIIHHEGSMDINTM